MENYDQPDDGADKPVPPSGGDSTPSPPAAGSEAPPQLKPIQPPHAPAVRPMTDQEQMSSIAEQIRRKVRDETGGAAPADPSFDLSMRMQAGGYELTDEAHQFTAETGEEYTPPPFQETTWAPVVSEDGGEASGLLKWVVIGGLIVILLIAGGMYGWPAYRDYQAHHAESAKAAELAKQPPLEAVTIDDAFYAGLASALRVANKTLQQSGKNAYVYRYRLIASTEGNTSQNLTVTATLGGSAAPQVSSSEGREALDEALQPWVTITTGHPGVHVQLDLVDGTVAGSAPLEGDRYVRYGYDYGREHLEELQPVIDSLEAKKHRDGHYPRVLDAGSGDQFIRTTGGFAFMARGVGYLAIYAADGAGNILMGSGDNTLDRLTPRAVTGYYLFDYLSEATDGLDCYGPQDLDYYTRKIAPLPYDPGDEHLHNVRLHPDGKPDGVGTIVKNGHLLRDDEH